MNLSTKKANWLTGSGIKLEFSQICEKVQAYSKDKSKIFIGTDSDVRKRKVIFCSAICIYGNSRSLYYFCRKKENNKIYPDLVSRITEEARLSIEIAEHLHNVMGIDKSMIELHLDVSPNHKDTKTSRISDALKGYVTGTGYTCKLKPNAWASQSVADRHSK
tara:strand:- start:59894 stop:60379 length:486 start_codon:yes stop_codon:yes gene_type:complete